MYKGTLVALVVSVIGLVGWLASTAVGQPESPAQVAPSAPAPQPVQSSNPPQAAPQNPAVPSFPALPPSVPREPVRDASMLPQVQPIAPVRNDQPRTQFPPLEPPPASFRNLPPAGPSTGTDLRLPTRTEAKPAPFGGEAAAPAAGERTFAPREMPSVEETPGQSNDNPTGRQEPAVSLEWIGPPTAKLGQPVTYQILVKNTCSIPVQNVVVRNRVPAGVNVQASEPRAIADGNTLLWDLGTLIPRQEKRIDLQILPEGKGDLACQAMVTFTGASVARIRVREPKLLLKAAAPDKVLQGDVATISLTVTNPGDGSADHVKIQAVLSDGLEHARGKNVEFDLGNLGPNETRSVQLVCGTKLGGMQTCDAVATAEGNLNSKDAANLEVILPRLDLAVHGPKLRYLDRKATYIFKITNPGSAPASNVSVTDQVPDGFKFLTASDGGRHDFATRTVTWYVGDLTPGQSREMSMEVLAINTGEHKHLANVTAARGLKTEAELVTRIEGLPALLMELVDLDDPVEVGADTAYEIRVTNTGSKTETNLQLVCVIPDKMEFRGAQGAAGTRFRLQGKDLIFEPLPRLAPRADAVYRVNVRGIAPGDLRFRARITADGLTDPVLKEESTKVYGDDAIK